MIIGVEIGSAGGLKRGWPGRTEQLTICPALRFAGKCDASPGVGSCPGRASGAAYVIKDQVMMIDVGRARGDDEMEYCRGRMGGSMLASCCSGSAMLEYLQSSRMTDARHSVTRHLRENFGFVHGMRKLVFRRFNRVAYLAADSRYQRPDEAWRAGIGPAV